MSKTYRNNVLTKDYSVEEVIKRYGNSHTSEDAVEKMKRDYSMSRKGYYSYLLMSYCPDGMKRYYRKKFNKKLRQDVKKYLNDIENERRFPIERDALGQLFLDI